MSKNNTLSNPAIGRKHREPLNDTSFLLTITICIFFAMYVFAMIVWGGGFLRPQLFLDSFNDINSALIILSCGLTVVMIAAGIDISVGGVTGLVAMCCAVFLNSPGGNVPGSMALALGIGVTFGVVQGFLVAYLEIQPFIISLAGMFFARGMTTIVYKEPVKVIHEGFLAIQRVNIEIPGLGYYANNGEYIPATIGYGAVIAIVVVLSVFCILRWSRFGRNLYAIGGNKDSALTLGINVKRTKFYSHLVCGLLAGIAGYTYVLATASANPAGDARFYEMKAIASSIIGGTLLTGGVGNVIGTLFGTLSLLTITKIVVTSGLTKPWWQQITTGAMLTFFIMLQSIVLSRRGKGGLKAPVPEWLRFKRPNKDNETANSE